MIKLIENPFLRLIYWRIWNSWYW